MRSCCIPRPASRPPAHTGWPFHLRGPIPGTSVTTPFDVEIDRPGVYVPLDTVPVHFAASIRAAFATHRRVWYIGSHGGPDYDDPATYFEQAGFALHRRRGFAPHYFARALDPAGREGHTMSTPVVDDVRAHDDPEPTEPVDPPGPRWRHARRFERIAAILALAAVFGGLYASYPRPWRKEPVFTSPRQSVGYELARQWAKTGKPVETLPLYNKVPKDIAPAFTPRDAASRKGQVVPKDFPLVVAEFAIRGEDQLEPRALRRAAHGRARADRVRLIGVGADPISSRRVARRDPLHVVDFVLEQQRVDLRGHTAAVCVVLLAVYAFVRASRSPNRGWDVLGGVACALAFGFRYDNAVIISVMWFAFLAIHRAGGVGTSSSLPSPLCSVPFLLFNKWLYGSVHTTRYALAYKLIVQTANI